MSEHFDLSEFEKDAPVPDKCVPVLTLLCTQILEPVSDKFGPQQITSGYRPKRENELAHGQPNSEHIYTSRKAAADINPLQATAREVFDWMRNNSMLPYHQLILEHGANGSSVVHISVNLDMPGVRSVLEGATHNASRYIKVDHVDYNPPNNNEAVTDALTAD